MQNADAIFNTPEFLVLSPSDKTMLLDEFSSKMSGDQKKLFLIRSNELMELTRQAQGVGRYFLENKIQATLKSVLSKDYDSLSEEEKISSIHKALNMCNAKSIEIDPVNRNDTAFFVSKELCDKLRTIRSKEIGEASDFVKRYYGEAVATATSSLDERGTYELLSRYLTTKPENDGSAIGGIASASGKLVTYLTPIFVIVCVVYLMRLHSKKSP